MNQKVEEGNGTHAGETEKNSQIPGCRGVGMLQWDLGDLMRTHSASAYLRYAMSVTHLSAGCQCQGASSHKVLFPPTRVRTLTWLGVIWSNPSSLT